MNIAGVLVHANPGQTDTVRNGLLAIEGVELHHETRDGRFIITVEDGENTRCDDTILALQDLPGVASAALVYHNFESANINASAELAAGSASPIRGA